MAQGKHLSYFSFLPYRRGIQIREGITEGVLCVYSIEKERKKLIPLSEEEINLIQAPLSSPAVHTKYLLLLIRLKK